MAKLITERVKDASRLKKINRYSHQRQMVGLIIAINEMVKKSLILTGSYNIVSSPYVSRGQDANASSGPLHKVKIIDNRQKRIDFHIPSLKQMK